MVPISLSQCFYIERGGVHPVISPSTRGSGKTIHMLGFALLKIETRFGK